MIWIRSAHSLVSSLSPFRYLLRLSYKTPSSLFKRAANALMCLSFPGAGKRARRSGRAGCRACGSLSCTDPQPGGRDALTHSQDTQSRSCALLQNTTVPSADSSTDRQTCPEHMSHSRRSCSGIPSSCRLPGKMPEAGKRRLTAGQTPA